jgi:hypothetical protein
MKSRDISNNSTRGSFCVSQQRRRIRTGFSRSDGLLETVVGAACGGTCAGSRPVASQRIASEELVGTGAEFVPRKLRFPIFSPNSKRFLKNATQNLVKRG